MSSALEKLREAIIEVKRESLSQDITFLNLCYPEMVEEVFQLLNEIIAKTDLSNPGFSDPKTTGEFSPGQLSEFKLLSDLPERPLVRHQAFSSTSETQDEFFQLFTRLKKNALFLAALDPMGNKPIKFQKPIKH